MVRAAEGKDAAVVFDTFDVPKPIKTSSNPSGTVSDEMVNRILKFIYHN